MKIITPYFVNELDKSKSIPDTNQSVFYFYFKNIKAMQLITYCI